MQSLNKIYTTLSLSSVNRAPIFTLAVPRPLLKSSTVLIPSHRWLFRTTLRITNLRLQTWLSRLSSTNLIYPRKLTKPLILPTTQTSSILQQTSICSQSRSLVQTSLQTKQQEMKWLISNIKQLSVFPPPRQKHIETRNLIPKCDSSNQERRTLNHRSIQSITSNTKPSKSKEAVNQVLIPLLLSKELRLFQDRIKALNPRPSLLAIGEYQSKELSIQLRSFL